MEEKYINRFESFKKSLASLNEVHGRDVSDSFVLSGAIQKFSITFDISWRVMKDVLCEHYGIIDFATGSPRETLKKAQSNGLINDDAWLDMMSDRNLLAHDYDGEIAKEKINTITELYIPLFINFKEKIEQICSAN